MILVLMVPLVMERWKDGKMNDGYTLED